MGSATNAFTFIDLFAGIGGFHYAMHSVGGRCVFASEIDKNARITYEYNLKKISPELFTKGRFNWDITSIDPSEIPDFDVLCAGFPCQPFSNAGFKRGFADTRGTLFFSISEIVRTKSEAGNPPKVIILENVKGLRSHDGGKTLKTILQVLNGLNYNVNYEILCSKNFGIPQNRQRIFIVAWLKTSGINNFKFPFGVDFNNNPIYEKELVAELSKPTSLESILDSEVDPKYTISDKIYQGHLNRLIKHREKGNGFGFSEFSKDATYVNTISARYWKDGSEILIKQDGKNPRKLHPKEAGRLQGFPIDNGFEIVVSDRFAWQQFGNSITVPVVKALAMEIKTQLLKNDQLKQRRKRRALAI